MSLPRMAEWRERWLQFSGGRTLHRVASITWEDADRIAGHGVTACSQFKRLVLPGVLSRLGAPRCRVCCAIAGLPDGKGAPMNQGIDA